MVVLLKRREPDGIVYSLKDYQAYFDALEQRLWEPPHVRYRVFVRQADEPAIRAAFNVEEEIAAFFRLGASTGIAYRVEEEPAVAEPTPRRKDAETREEVKIEE